MSESDVTRLLGRLSQGEPRALEELIATVYPELHRMSGVLMSRERTGHTLQPTALIHEAFLRMVDSSSPWQNRAHFFGAAARAMRRVLVDHARSRSALKRSGAGLRVTFEELSVAAPDPGVDLLALEEALAALEERDGRLVRMVELRYFGGFSIDETAQILGVSPATVKRDWQYARAWLLERVGGPSDTGSES